MYELTMPTQVSLQQNTPPTNNYLLGKQDAIERLDAKKRGNRKQKLNCKPGFVQRGAVCQPKGRKKIGKNKLLKRRKAPLAPILQTVLTTAALTGAVKIGSYAAQLTQVTQDKEAELRKAKLKQNIAIATAVGAVGVAGVVSYKPLKEKSLKGLSDLSLLTYEKLTSIKNIDHKIDKLDNISDKRKAQLKNLSGDLKGFALAAHLRSSQAKVIKIDKKNNLVHYQAKDGSIISRGQVGSSSLLMRMKKNPVIKLPGNIPVYETDFMLDGHYDREEHEEKRAEKDTRKKNIKVVKRAMQMYSSQAQLIEDEAVLYGVVNAADDAYKKRYNLYTRQGLIDTPPVERELKKLIRMTTPERGVASGTILFDYKIKGELVKGKRQKDVHLKSNFRLPLNREESDFVAATRRIESQEKTIEQLEKKKIEETGLSNLNQRRLNNLKEQQEKDLEIISKFDSALRNLKDNAYIASLERQFNLVPSLMSQDYILAHQEVVALLDARRSQKYGRQKRLKCKPGFVQRGAVCQPIRRSKGKLLTVAATTAAAGATAAIVLKNRQKSSPLTTVETVVTSWAGNPPRRDLPKKPSLSFPTKKELAIAAGSAGTAAGITYAVARNQRQKAVEETISRGKKEVVEVMASYAKDQAKRETEVAEKEAQLNGQVGKLQADLAAINNRNTQAQQELEAANNRISRLEKAELAGVQQVAKLSQELDEVVSSKNKTTEELVAAKTALSQAEEMVENVRAQRDNLNNMVRDLETQLQSTRTQKEQELNQLQSQLKEVESQRTQLAQGLREQETKLEELDRQSAETLKSRLADQQQQFEGQLQAKQKQLEDEIAKGSDPKPKKGQSARRGDLIASSSGVALGASHRWNSNFFNLSPVEQQQKLQNKVNQLLDKSYSDRLLGLQRDFTERIQATIPPQKKPFTRLSDWANTVQTSTKKIVEQLKGKEKELLPRLVELEKDVAQHNLREEVLEYANTKLKEKAIAEHQALLESFQAYAVEGITKRTYQAATPSSAVLSSESLAEFDRNSEQLIKGYNQSLNDVVNKIISPKFAKQIQGVLGEYVEEAPTETIVMRKRKQVAIKLSEKIISDLLNIRTDAKKKCKPGYKQRGAVCQKYTKPKLREKLKAQILAGDKGGPPGRVSSSNFV